MDVIVSRPGEGERLAGEKARELRVKAARSEFSLFEFSVGPDYEGPGPHYHRDHVDSFYVLEGELEFQVADETIAAPAGTFVLVPPNVVHGFTNRGPSVARFLNIHAPGGFEEHFRKMDRGEKIDPDEHDVHEAK